MCLRWLRGNFLGVDSPFLGLWVCWCWAGRVVLWTGGKNRRIDVNTVEGDSRRWSASTNVIVIEFTALLGFDFFCCIIE